MKIFIIGGPGSRKTYLAKKLSKELGIRHYDLDELQSDAILRHTVSFMLLNTIQEYHHKMRP